jgi:SPW repeat-containing protein
MMKRRRETILDVYTLLLAAFLFVSPWLFAYARDFVRIDAWVAGGLLIAVSLAAILAFAEWEEWVILAGGLWLLASPWILGFTHTTAMHISIGIGCVVTFLAALELWLIHYDRPQTG